MLVSALFNTAQQAEKMVGLAVLVSSEISEICFFSQLSKQRGFRKTDGLALW